MASSEWMSGFWSGAMIVLGASFAQRGYYLIAALVIVPTLCCALFKRGGDKGQSDGE